jgi:hypothetical protein
MATLDEILSQVYISGSDAQAIGNEEAQIFSDMAGVRTKQEQVLTEASQRISSAATQEGQAAQVANTQSQRALQVIDFDNILVNSVADYNKAYAAREAANNVIAQKESVGFLDNPVDWVTNQLTLEQDYAALNAATRSQQMAEDKIRDMHNFADAHMSTALNSVKALQVATQASVTQAQGSQMLSAAYDKKIEGYLSGINALEALGKASKQKLDAMLKVGELIYTEDNKAALNENRRLTAENTKAIMTQREETMRQKKQDADAEAERLNLINTGAKQLGREPFQSMSQVNNLALDKRQKKFIDMMYSIGAGATYNAMSAASSVEAFIADTPAEAAELLVGIRGRLPENQSKINKVLVDTYRGVVGGGLGAANLDRRSPEIVNGEVNKLVRIKLDAFKTDVASDITSNPFAPLPVQAIVENIGPELKESPVYQKVIAPVVATNPAAVLPPQEMMRLVSTAVASRSPEVKISWNEATDWIAKYYQYNMQMVNSNNQITAIGELPLTKYKAKVQSDPAALFFTGGDTYDMSSPTEVANLLGRMLRARDPFNSSLPKASTGAEWLNQ